jgi:hypothetical protein
VLFQQLSTIEEQGEMLDESVELHPVEVERAVEGVEGDSSAGALHTTPRVTLVRDRYVAAGAERRTVVAPLVDALARTHDCDAHFQQGFTPSGTRFAKSALGVEPITMTCLAVDLDPPGHVPTDEWRADTRAGARAAIAVLPAVFYETKNGARLVIAIEPVTIAVPADAAMWALRYRAALDYIKSTFGLHGDRSCSDFSRLFRLPRIVREPGEPSANPFALGELSALSAGRFALPEPAPQDDAPRSTHAAQATPTGPVNGARDEDRGVLYRMLEWRKAIVAPWSPAGSDVRGWQIVCPNARHHGPRPGDHAVLMPGPVGRIVCQRTACQGITEWLPFFNDAELEAAGITLAQVRDVYPSNRDAAGRERIGLRVEADGVGHYYRCSVGTPAYERLLAAGHTTDPEKLKRCWLGLTFDAGGRIDRVHCIEAAP